DPRGPAGHDGNLAAEIRQPAHRVILSAIARDSPITWRCAMAPRTQKVDVWAHHSVPKRPLCPQDNCALSAIELGASGLRRDGGGQRVADRLAGGRVEEVQPGRVDG